MSAYDAPRQPPVAILAGGGLLPIEIAETVEAAGRKLHIVAIDGHADAALSRWPMTRVRIGEVGRMLDAFAAAGCRDLVIAGSLARPDLRRLRVDLGALRRLPVMLTLFSGGDDSLLRRIVRFFEREGLRVVGVGDVAPALLAPAGPLGSFSPSPAHEAAIACGRRLVDRLSPFDVGQAVVATPDRILAIEGTDGTDAMLGRLAEAGIDTDAARAGVLVKLAKRGQELRVDLPAIGPATIEKVAAAGLAGIAVEAGSAVVLGRRMLIEAADRASVFVSGVEVERDTAETATHQPSQFALRPLGRRTPGPDDRLDARLALAAVQAARNHGGGDVSVVLGRHVLGVGAQGERSADVIERSARRKPWGGRLLRRRAGVVACATSSTAEVEAAVLATRQLGLAGLALHGAAAVPIAAGTIALADRLGLFILSADDQP